MNEVEYLKGQILILQAQNDYLMNRIKELIREQINKEKKIEHYESYNGETERRSKQTI